MALSLKQPWAALLVAGVKTIEVRTWKTSRRGIILIHAAKVPDPRPEAWAWVTTPELRELSQVTGGLIGLGELTDCRAYPTHDKFLADQGLHLNAPDWFRDSGLFGFVFRELRRLPFHPYPGNTFFFPVHGFDLKLPPTGSP